jgi:hypothetical protein
MYCMRPVPFAILLQLNLALDEFPVLARPIVRAAALLARQFYELILGHSERHYIENSA